jgi:hypothetical protein
MTLLYIFVILHIITAASWFGLALGLTSRSRLIVALEGSAARAAADDAARSVRMMTVLAALTFIFALGAFFTGGGFSTYGMPFHTSMLLILILLAIQIFLIQRPMSALHTAAGTGSPDAVLASRKRLGMGLGIGQLIWLLLLVMMFWDRLTATI